jgi:hypothetical protein
MADVDLFVIQKEWTNLGNKKMLTWKKVNMLNADQIK